MLRVDVTPSAKVELLSRANWGNAFLVQPGPAHEQYHGPEWTAEDDAFGPRQRWVIMPIATESFEDMPRKQLALIQAVAVDEFKFMVFCAPQDGVLNIEFAGGALHVRETAA